MKTKLIAVIAVAMLAAGATARAEPVTATICNAGACAPIDPVVAGVVIAAGILEKPIARNLEAAKKESSLLNKAVRVTTGISIRNIKKYGLAGGPNSEVRKAGRTLAKVFGW